MDSQTNLNFNSSLNIGLDPHLHPLLASDAHFPTAIQPTNLLSTPQSPLQVQPLHLTADSILPIIQIDGPINPHNVLCAPLSESITSFVSLPCLTITSDSTNTPTIYPPAPAAPVQPTHNFAIQAGGIVTFNGKSELDGNPLDLSDDAFVYADKGFSLNGKSILPVQRDSSGKSIKNSQGKLTLLDQAIVVTPGYLQSNSNGNNNYANLTPPQVIAKQTITIPSYAEIKQQELANRIPAGAPTTTFSTAPKPQKFPTGGTATLPKVIRITNGGLNLTKDINLSNSVIIVDNGDINIKGDAKLNNVVFVANNGSINLNEISATNSSFLASRRINANCQVELGGKTLLATGHGDITFNREIDSTKHNPQNLEVIAQGRITLNGSSHVRGDFRSTGTFSSNGKADIYGTVASLGDIVFNGASNFTYVNLGNIHPHVPTLQLVATSDSGISNSDKITNINTPTISGTGDIGAKIKLTDGTNLLGETRVGSCGTWQIVSSALTNGTHSLTATAIDLAGNISTASAPLNLVIDTVLPQLTLTTPLAQTTLKNNAKLTGTINGTGSEIASINYHWDNSPTNIAIAPNSTGGFDQLLDYTGIANGTHKLTISATDIAGNITTSSYDVAVAIDKQAPVITAKLATDTGVSNSDKITFNPTITGTINDANQIAGFKASFDGINYVNILTQKQPDGTFTLDKTELTTVAGKPLVDGNYTLHLIATDEFGNASANYDVAFTLDTTITVPNNLKLADGIDTGASNNDNITNINTPIITGTGDVGATIKLNDGNTLIGETTVGNDGTWQIVSSQLTNATHTLTAIATDIAGNISNASTPLNIIIDTVLPALTLTTPLDLSPLKNNAKLMGAINGTGSEIASINYHWDNSTTNITIAPNSNGGFDQPLDYTGIANGAHKLTIAATDIAGNITTSSYNVTVAIDKDAPVINAQLKSDTGTSNSDKITFNPTINGTVLDANKVAGFTASLDRINYVDILPQLQPDGTFTLDRTQLATVAGKPLVDGDYILHLIATDEFGNASQNYDLAFTLDTTITVPNNLKLAVGSDTGVSNSDNITNINTPTITGTGDIGATITLKDGNTLIGETTVCNDGTWQIVSSKLTDGIHSINAIATDIAGNISNASAPLNLVIDTLAPLLNLTTPLTALKNDAKLAGTIDGSGSNLVGVNYYWDNSPNNIAIAPNSTGGFNQTLDFTGINNGAHTLTITATDLAGNILTSNYNVNVVLDKEAPIVNLQLASDTGTNSSDRITNNPNITGKVTDASGISAVTISLNPDLTNSVNITASLQADGSFSFDKAALTQLNGGLLPDGNYQVYLQAVDTFGNTTTPQTLDFQLLTNEKPSSVSALLANDTGISNSDLVTLDPTVSGKTVNTVTLLGSLNGKDFVDLSKALNPDGSFTVSLEQYQLLTNGSFPDGSYNLILKGQNIAGNESPVATVNFTLDRTPPAVTFDLAPESDTGAKGDRITTERTVSLIGQTEPGLEVVLVGTQQKVTADPTGKFTFTNVPMPVAGQAPYTIVARDAAGNQGQVLNFLTREGINGAPKIISNPGTVLDTTKDKTYTYQLAATDPDGDALTYSLLNSPPDAVISSGGLISFTPTGVLQSSYDFGVEVSDGRGGRDAQTFKVGLPGVVDSFGIIRGIEWNDVNGNASRDNEIGLSGVSVYLDSNNNGVLDKGEPVQVTSKDDPSTPNIDETGQYEFKNLLPGKYIVREVIPTGFKQTFPVKNITQSGNAYADVILDFVSGGNAPAPLVEPYGSTGGILPPSAFNGKGKYSVGPVNPNVVLGPPPPSPIIGSNSKVDWLALPKDSYVTVGFTDKVAIDGPGDDIFIRSFDRQDSANESADVFVSSNGVDFKLLGTVNERGLVSLDLAKINFTEPVTAVRVKGLDNLGSSPGFDLIGVEILPRSVAKPDFYTIDLKAGQLVENINFGNAEIIDTSTVNSPPEIVSTSPTNIEIGNKYEYQVIAFDRNKDPLKYSLTKNPPGLTIDTNGLITWTPTAIGTFPIEIKVDDSKGGIATQKIDLVVTKLFVESGIIRGTKWEDLNGNGSRENEPGLAGVRVYLDINNNGIFDNGEPVQTTSVDDPNTANIDETGKYEFNNLLPGKYIVREVTPAGFQQTFPVKTITQSGNADVILDFVSGGNAPSPLVEPYGSTGGTLPPSVFNGNGKYSVGSVNPNVILGAPPSSPIVSSNSKVDWLALPKDSYVTVGFTDKVAIDGPGDDIFIRSFDLQDSANESADVFVSSNGVDFKLLGTVNESGIVSLDLAKINFTEPVTAVRVKGLDNLGSSPGFDLIGVEILPGSIASPDFHTINLKAGQVVENINFGNTKIIDTSTVNYPPVILSTSPTNISIGNKYEYQLVAFDRNKDLLKYSVIKSPSGLTIDANGLISWIPTSIGTFPIEIQVDDSKGGIATQKIALVVAEASGDKEAPQIKFGFNSSVFNVGETLDLQVQGFDNVGLTDLKLSFNGDPVTINPNTLANGSINTASIVLSRIGVFEVLATAKDAAGNVGTKNLKVRVIDPTEKTAPFVELNLSQFDPLKPITDVTNIIGTVNDPRIEFYRVEIAPVSSIDLKNPGANDSDFITIAEGKGNVNNGILAKIDPRLYRNDNYYLRIYAQDFNGNINVKGAVIGISSETKPGEFRLEYTDLTVPLTGIPIEIKRVYNSLDAQINGDFGYGWNLALQDAQIQEASPTGVDLKSDSLFGGNSFTVGTRVTLNTPDGRRVGFTFNPTVSSDGLLGDTIYQPTFTPDAGVFETLEVNYTPLSVRSNGSVALYLFGFIYNPSEYRLKTKEGTVYRYDQVKGLLDVTDRNGNKLTYTDTGITSSTGQSITFKRDTQNRITEIIDPNGKAIKYSYDAKGDLNGVSDRTNATTQLQYQNPRPHYLTEVIDPLGRSAGRTEYDEQGRIKRLIDAAGNALDLSYTNGASSQTIKDPLGNNITRIFDKRGNVVEEIDQLGGSTKRTFDANARLLSQTDPLGNITTYTYDNRGNLLSQTNPLGQTQTYTYNALNQLLTATDALGNTTQKTYDSQGNLLSLTDAAGKITKYTYDKQGNVSSITNSLNGVTTYAYDAAGHVTTITDALNQKLTSTYDVSGNLTSTTTSGHTTKFTYDASGRPLTITDALGNVSKFEYNAAGERTATIDALGRRTQSTYNSIGQIAQILYADGTTEKFTYDVNGRKIGSTDRGGRTTNYVYDSLGRLINTIEPDSTPNTLTDNPQVRREYDADGRLTAIVDELGNRTTFTYDAAGEQIAIVDALGNKTTKTYTATGLLASITDPLNHTTQLSYDALGRATSTRYADGTSTINTLDTLGRIIAKTDEAGVTTQYSYDADGRLIAVIDALGQRTEYGYDAEGNLISQKDASGNVTTYQYDAIKELIATTLPLGQKTTKTYDAVGNLLSATDFNGQTTAYQYNTNNEVTVKKFADGTSLTYTYTPTLQQATATGTQGITKYSYDERDRLILATQPDSKTIAYTYDAAGNKTAQTTTAGTVGYSYDALNQLQTVTDPTGKVTTYTYNSVGDLTKTQLANGIQETRLYDSLDRLTSLQQTGSSNSIVSSYTYTLDATGKRLSETDADGHKANYTYDSIGRLTQEAIVDPVIGNRTIQYTYNATGNRLTRADSIEGTTTYSYDANDRLLTQLLNGQTTQYSYDNNGNTLAVSVNGTTQATYGWDAQGKLTAATVNTAQGTQNTKYIYDANGNRVATVVNGVETRYLVDTNGLFSQVVEAYAPNVTTQTAYVRGLSLISQTQQGTQSFDLTDGLGTVRSLTNSTGAVTDRYTYDAFGRLIGQQGITPNTAGFAGEQFDTTTNTYNLRARNYDPNTGRFISQDTFGGFQDNPSSLQKYVYTQNSPVNFIDPSGHDFFEYALLLKGKSIKVNGKATSAVEIAGAVSGGLTGFGITNLAFIGNILEIANKGGDVIAEWEDAVQKTEDEIGDLNKTFSKIEKAGDKAGGSAFVSSYISGTSLDFKIELQINSSPKSKSSKSYSKTFKLEYGGFEKGSESGIKYLESLNPNKKE